MKKNNQYRMVLFLIALFFSFTSAVSARMTSENFCLSSSVVCSGGMTMSSASYYMNSTLGQPTPIMDSDNPLQSITYKLFSGFWYTVGDKSSQDIIDVGQGYNYSSLQEALDDAHYGDIIVVHDGIYYENIVLQGQGVIICSENGPEGAIISGNASGPVVTFENVGRNAVLMGLTITDGYAEKGGGILCLNSSPFIVNCLIIDNAASDMGGGIYGDNSYPMIINCLLQGNMENAGPNQICLKKDNPLTFKDTQIVSFSDDEKVYFQIHNQYTGRWQAGYRFFSAPCGVDSRPQADEYFFISFLP